MAQKEKLTCIEALCITAINHDLSWDAFKVLAKFLDCETYIYPEDRKLDKELVSYVVLIHIEDEENAGILRHGIFKAWMVLDKVEMSLSLEQQRNILSWKPLKWD